MQLKTEIKLKSNIKVKGIYMNVKYFSLMVFFVLQVSANFSISLAGHCGKGCFDLAVVDEIRTGLLTKNDWYFGLTSIEMTAEVLC